MGITVRQVMKYLSEYPDEAKLGVMVADTKNRKKYQIKDGNWLDMFSYPVCRRSTRHGRSRETGGM